MYGRARVQSVIFVPDAEVWSRRDAPGGLALLERQLRQLRRLALPPPLLLVAPDADPVLPPDLEAGAIVHVPGAGDVVTALVAAVDALPDRFVFLTADRLVDPRVIRALAAAPELCLACGDGDRAEPVGRADAADVRRHGMALPAHAGRRTLDALDRYVPELRGDADPYLFAVRSAADRARGWRVLLDHVQKRTLDLPGQYFDTPFENFFVRRLAPTTISPNQVTVLTLVVACGVGWLFLHGWLRAGVVLALLVGVLDGVDGKLARMKYQWSRLGELEHVGDFLYENSWYLALGAYFRAASGADGFLWLAGVLVACDLTDSLLYALARRRTGRMLDEIAAFDRRFRRIAGRRNVYVMIFVVGFFAGAGPYAFAVAAAWAGCTVAVHAVRAVSASPAPA